MICDIRTSCMTIFPSVFAFSRLLRSMIYTEAWEQSYQAIIEPAVHGMLTPQETVSGYEPRGSPTVARLVNS